MKKCNYCHVEKPLVDFPIKKDGSYSGNCLECREKRKEKANTPEVKQKRKLYYEDNKDDILAARKEYYQENKEDVLARNKNNYELHKEDYLEYKKEYYQENREHYLQLSKEDRQNNPEKYLWKAAKKRAKEKELPFDITIEDIIIPDVCPIFGFPLMAGNILERDNSPSLDRIIPELGYVKGNIKVISFKANTLKRDGHIEDFEKIIKYIGECINENRS